MLLHSNLSSPTPEITRHHEDKQRPRKCEQECNFTCMLQYDCPSISGALVPEPSIEPQIHRCRSSLNKMAYIVFGQNLCTSPTFFKSSPAYNMKYNVNGVWIGVINYSTVWGIMTRKKISTCALQMQLFSEYFKSMVDRICRCGELTVLTSVVRRKKICKARSKMPGT
jgi:hypothetical protein